MNIKVSNSPHKYRTRGAVKAISCSLISSKIPETLARPKLSNKQAKPDSETDWQEVNYKKKSIKAVILSAMYIPITITRHISSPQFTGYPEIAQ